jgi:hypothetical protein
MGLFDYIKCEYPLPEGAPNVAEFQTKDAQEDPYMETFRITKEGRLIHETCQYVEVPKSERPYPNEKGLMGLAGSIRSFNTGDRDTGFHGSLNFCGNSDNSEWVEFVCLFKDGTLIDIRRTNER